MNPVMSPCACLEAVRHRRAATPVRLVEDHPNGKSCVPRRESRQDVPSSVPAHVIDEEHFPWTSEVLEGLENRLRSSRSRCSASL